MAAESQLSRARLTGMALRRFGIGLVVIMVLVLLPAGTFRYWQAWAFLAALLVPMGTALVYLLRKDPALLERRMRVREKEAAQGLLITMGTLCYVLVFVLAGLDRRFGWSHVPGLVVLLADLLILLGYALFLQVLRANSYASRVVEVEQGQQLVTTGPYAVVRHPMYVATLAIFMAAPVALGSWWSLLPALPLFAVIVARIRNEEQVLGRQLAGYPEYMQHTRYRLVPGVW